MTLCCLALKVGTLDSSQQPWPHVVGLATAIPVHAAGKEGAGRG